MTEDIECHCLVHNNVPPQELKGGGGGVQFRFIGGTCILSQLLQVILFFTFAGWHVKDVWRVQL